MRKPRTNIAFISILTVAAPFIITPTNSHAGWLDKAVKDAGKILKQVPKIANPIQVQVDIVRGKKTPDKAIKDFVSGQGKAIATIANSSRNLTNSVDQQFEKAAAKIGGDFGRVIYQMSHGSGRLQREFVFTNANAIGAVLQGKDPLLMFTTPLAAAIRDARNKHYPSSKPIPSQLFSLLKPVVPEHVLRRARYVVGDLRISMPSVINKSQEFFGGVHSHAVTVDDVIVFSREPDLNKPDDIHWWAHELYHVFQYSEWGVDLFAYRYTKNYTRVEGEAEQSASYVSSYLSQLGLRSNIQPRVMTIRSQIAQPVSISTPIGNTVVYKPASGVNFPLSQSVSLTDRCVIQGEQIAVSSTNQVFSLSQGMKHVGARTAPVDSLSCAFDLVSTNTNFRYCVHKPTGVVYAGSPIQLGRCFPCSGPQCIK